LTQPVEIKSLTMTAAATRLQLWLQNAPLTINGGGTIAGGVLSQSYKGKASDLSLTGGTLTWTGGNINWIDGQASVLANLYVGTSATFDVDLGWKGLPGPKFGYGCGDNITTAAPLAGKAGGNMILENTAPVVLEYQPTITNNGVVNITGDSAGLLVPLTDKTMTIQNYGIWKKTAGTSAYTIADPIVNKSPSAVLELDKGDLTVTVHCDGMSLGLGKPAR
jgi:hypothetical protein